MNQILSTSMPMDNRKKKNKRDRNTQPIEIGSIVKFFGIIILIFGVFIVGTGVYAIYSNHTSQQEESLEPTISIENKDDSTILLKVTHKKNIAKMEYGWNQDEKITVNGKGGNYLEQEISIPSGTNILHVSVQDEDGNESTYEKQYELDSNINIEVSANKIKITYEGDTNVSYMTYRWNEDEETKIEFDEETKSIEQEIEAIKGTNELTIVVVDENNRTDTKVQPIKGITKPKLTIELDDEKEHFIINASDDEKLSKIEFVLTQNDESQPYRINLEDKELKEIEYIVQKELQQGENIIEVTVYNSNNVTQEYAARFFKQ